MNLLRALLRYLASAEAILLIALIAAGMILQFYALVIPVFGHTCVPAVSTATPLSAMPVVPIDSTTNRSSNSSPALPEQSVAVRPANASERPKSGGPGAQNMQPW